MNKGEKLGVLGLLMERFANLSAIGVRLACVPLAVGVVAWAPAALAANGRADYDLDNDRLIEINDLQDLNAIRNNLAGLGIYGASPATLGCPGGCNGFELTTNLNFDTNGNGSIDAGDQYYNGGVGWWPIGMNSQGAILGPFTGLFNGNGFQISNLYCNGAENCGLFNEVRNTTVSNLKIANADLIFANEAQGIIASRLMNSTLRSSSTSGKMWGTAGSGTGGLVGVMTASTIDECYSSTLVQGATQNGGLVGIASAGSVIKRSFFVGRTSSWRHHWYSGGIAGVLQNSSIDNCFATANVADSYGSGGLVGLADSTSSINRSFATGRQIGTESPRGGLLGSGNPVISNSYWAVDLTGQAFSPGGGVGHTVSQLKCPTSSLDPACVLPSYATWGTQVNSAGTALWNQGTSSELPGLNIQGALFRDGDGDGVLDAADYYPTAYAASANSDADMSINQWKEGCDAGCRAASGFVLDQFPTKIAASIDLDLDGRPDAWNPNCTAGCQNASGLTLDTRPGDLDNDGISDAVDNNDDGNGAVDIDQNSNGLVDIETPEELNWMRHQTLGYGQRAVPWVYSPIGIPDDTSDTSGCPPRLLNGVLTRACQGYELLNDVNLDTNGNGSFGAGDQFYNAGSGWDPVGYNSDVYLQAFQTKFEGNGHRILNLVLNRPGGRQLGLFGATRDATIQNLGLTGSQMHVYGGSEVGGLIGVATRTTVREVYSTGDLETEGNGQAGGLIGAMFGGQIIGSFTTGEVFLESECLSVCGAGGLVGAAAGGRITASFATGPVYGDWIETGGLVGVLSADESFTPFTTIEGSYSTGYVNGNAPIGGLVGSMPNGTVASHWATDSSSQTTSAGNPVGATLPQLQCPTSANDTACAPGKTLFSSWNSYLDEDGAAYWNFGGNTELPGLCYEGMLYRDAQGDGVLDTPIPCTTPSPCTGICNNPVNLMWTGTYNGNNLGTGALCFQTTQAIAGGNCGNFAAGRTLTVNGQSRPCTGANWSSVPAPVNGGYCIKATAGDYASAFITLW